MSKTAEEIGLIVGGIALASVPGLQWAGVIAISGHAALLSAMFGIGLSTALSGVGLALRPPLKPVGTAGSINFSSGVSPRRVIYGQFQTAGVLTYASFPASQNQSTFSQYLHLIYTLCGHEIESFDAVIVDGIVYNFGTDIQQNSSLAGFPVPWQVNPDNSAGANDFYWRHMFFEFDGGNAQNVTQPFSNLAASDSAWTSACLQRGCAKVHVILRADSGWPAVFPGGAIPNIQFLVTGKKLIDPRVVTSWQPSTTYAHYSYIVDNSGIIWFQSASSGSSSSSRPNFEANDSYGTTLSDGALTWYSTGNSLIGVYLSNSPNTIPSLAGNRLLNDGWTPGFSGSFSANSFLIEAPVGYLQMVTSGGTTGTTRPAFGTTVGAMTVDNTMNWVCLGRSTRALNPSNPALVVYDYLQDSDAGLGTPASAIDTASVIAAANVCEEQVLIIWNPDNTTVYEDLYSCSGSFDHSSTRGNALGALCGSMAGWVIPPGDQWHVFAGAYVTPTFSLTDDDLRAPIKGDFRLSKREIANSIKGTYVPAFLPASPAAAISMTVVPGTWHAQSYPPYQANGFAGKPDYLNSEDAGQVIWQDANFEFTTSVWTAQRLAKIALMRLRFQETLTLSCKLTAFAIEAGDTLSFTHLRWGLLNAIYEVTQVSIVIESGKDGSPAVGIDVVARRTDPSIYEFTPPSSAVNYGEYSPYPVTGELSGLE